MEWLRIELRRKPLDAILGHLQRASVKDLSDFEIFQVMFSHLLWLTR
jgi:hypothetical protein